MVPRVALTFRHSVYSVTRDTRPLPPPVASQEDDDLLFADEPWVSGPGLQCDYGFNVRLGPGVFLNFNATFIDTSPINIGARTLIGPGCSFYSGTHPLDPALRNGINGPELGKDINIGEDCWLGGNVIILPGITVGQGSTIGAGSVVTKDIPPFHVAAGNPAQVLKRIATEMDPSNASTPKSKDQSRHEGAEVPMAQASSQ